MDIMNKKQIAALTLGGLLVLAGSSAFAAESPDKQAQAAASVQKEVSKEGQQAVSDAERAILEEAVSSLKNLDKAMASLQKGDVTNTVKQLTDAIGDIEAVIAVHPDLALAPVDVETIVVDITATLKTIRKAVDKATDLLEDGKVQDARRILSGLASEIVIETTNIPLASYPGYLKQAVALLAEDKKEAAAAVLEDAVNTLVITRDIIPLPLIRAEHMFAKAQKLMETGNRSKQQQTELLDLLGSARYQLELAQALGYGDKSEYKPMFKEIEHLAKLAKKGKKEINAFAEINLKIDRFLRKHFGY